MCIFSARAMRGVLHENHALQAGRDRRKSRWRVKLTACNWRREHRTLLPADARARFAIGSPIRADVESGDNKRIDLSSLGEITAGDFVQRKVLVYGTKPTAARC